MASESVTLRDLIVAVFRHYRSRLRQQFIDADTAVWRVSDEIDFARWQRQVNQPNTPEIEEWLKPRPGAAWPDPFFDLDEFGDDLPRC